MPTSLCLKVACDDFDYEVFLNDRDKIFFGENSESVHQSFVIFEMHDWPNIKKFIDRVYNEWVKQQREKTLLLNTENCF